MGTIAQFEEEEWSISLTELGQLAMAVGATPPAQTRTGRSF